MQQLADWIGGTSLSAGLAAAGWLVPTVQTLHILALAVVLSSVLMIQLRLLGLAGREHSFVAALARFEPWFWGGLAALALTGVTLIVAEPLRELMAISFWVKMVLLAIAVVASASLHRAMRRGVAMGLPAKVAAGTIFALWCAVVLLGRFIAYDAQLWGERSYFF